MKYFNIALLIIGFIFGCSTVNKMMGKKKKSSKANPSSTLSPTDRNAAENPGESPENMGAPNNSGVGGEALMEGESNLINTNIIWRRYRALESRYTKAFKLKENELCNEVGKISCVNRMHLYNLGGNDPIDAGQTLRPTDPTFLSSVALDRLAMKACSNRIVKDKALTLGEAITFKFFKLDSSPVPKDQVSDFVVHLYRSILARDPEEKEIAAIQEFAKTSGSSENFAHQTCYAVATMLENIFI